MRSSLFFGVYAFLMRSAFCFIMNVNRRQARFNTLFCFFISSFAILVEPAGRRPELSLYMFPKIFEALWAWLLKRKLVVNVKNGEVLLFAFAMAVIMMCYQTERKNMKSSYISILEKFYGEN
mmetsp:Transcript_3408/g.3368  ORF Transcript_3408/g.3368 Transcript_3408/m.3368 type:complete len:122 (+) Transcript_3408:87-452(+)